MVTITDVAARAGVSRTTVSYVLSAGEISERISLQTRNRVMEAVAELGYRRNALAHAVTTGQSRMLGFWVMQSNREPVVRVLAGAMKEADANGYFIKMLGFDNQTAPDAIIQQCIEWRLSGIIAIHAPEELLKRVHPQIQKAHIPAIIVDSQQPPSGSIHIASDSAGGISQVMDFLFGQGHHDVAFIAGYPDASDRVSMRRESAYRQAMKVAGLEDQIRVHYGSWNYESTAPTEAATRELLEGARRPTAIVCVSDHTAMVAIRTAAQMNVRVPDELSVTGFDDVAVAALYNPPLTTVSQSFEAMGALAVQHLLRGQNNGEAPCQEELLPTRIIVRNSTAPI